MATVDQNLPRGETGLKSILSSPSSLSPPPPIPALSLATSPQLPPPQRTIVKMFENHGDKDASHSPHYVQQQASEHREGRSDFSGELLGKGSQHLCVNQKKVPAGSARSWVRTSAPPAPESGSQHIYHSRWPCPHDSNAAPLT